MPTNTATIVINAPASRVFEALDTPETHFAISPSLTEMGQGTKKEEGGHDVGFTMRMLGVTLKGTVRIKEHNPPTRIAWRMEGDLEGDLSFTLDPGGDDTTTVTYEANYENPAPVLKAVTDPLISRYNQREIETCLANLKDRLEHM